MVQVEVGTHYFCFLFLFFFSGCMARLVQTDGLMIIVYDIIYFLFVDKQHCISLPESLH